MTQRSDSGSSSRLLNCSEYSYMQLRCLVSSLIRIGLVTLSEWSDLDYSTCLSEEVCFGRVGTFGTACALRSVWRHSPRSPKINRVLVDFRFIPSDRRYCGVGSPSIRCFSQWSSTVEAPVSGNRFVDGLFGGRRSLAASDDRWLSSSVLLVDVLYSKALLKRVE